MSNKTQAQHEALAQLRAALAACAKADLPVVAQAGDSAYLLDGVGEATEDGSPVVVLWLDDGRWVELDGDDCDDCDE